VGVTGRLEGDSIESVSLWDRSATGDLEWSGHQPPSAKRYEAAGIDVRDMIK
jgi:hypothetical protein